MICSGVKVVEEQKGAEASKSAENLLSMPSFDVPTALMKKLAALAPPKEASAACTDIVASDHPAKRRRKTKGPE